MEITYISNEQELHDYLDQLELMQIREIGNLLGFPSTENPFGLKHKIVAAFTVLVELYGVSAVIPATTYKDKVPAGTMDLLAWRDACLERLAQHEPTIYHALDHWQLSLF